MAFDEHEPEYGTLNTFYGEFNDESLIKLLSICAATQDFQLNGDAQRFWQTLTDVSLSHGSLSTVDDLLGHLMCDGNHHTADIKFLSSGIFMWFCFGV